MNRIQPGGTMPRAVTGASDGVFDGAGLLRRVQDNEDLAVEIVAVFCAGVPARLCELQSRLANGEWRDLEMLAHALKGAAATVSAGSMRESARQLELAAGTGDRQTGARSLAALGAQFGELESRLEETGWRW
jgi:HPt (histidine-containing phosphotransfer) domain-containing protein